MNEQESALERQTPELLRLPLVIQVEVRPEIIIIGGKTARQFLDEYAADGVKVNYWAKLMLENAQLTTLQEPKPFKIGVIPLYDLAILTKTHPATKDIEKRRVELGLDTVPAEAALHYLQQNGHKLQSGEVIAFYMKHFVDAEGHPVLFQIRRDPYTGEIHLWPGNAGPGDMWNTDTKIAFGLGNILKS